LVPQPSTPRHDVHSFPTRRSSDLNLQAALPFARVGAGQILLKVGFTVLVRISRVPADRRVGQLDRREVSGLPRFHVFPVLTAGRSEEHTSELQSRFDLVCRLLLEK